MSDMSQEAIGGVSQEAQDMQTEFWQKTLNDINKMSGEDFKVHELPLARIKKIMKLDEEVKRNDIAMAITKYDQFDFLIDIVPREEIKSTTKRSDEIQRTPVMADHVQYYFQLAQQAAQNNSQQNTTSGQVAVQQQQPVQLQLGGTTIPAITIQPQTMGEVNQPTAQQPQVIQVHLSQQQQQQQSQPQQQQQQQDVAQAQVAQTPQQEQHASAATTQVFQQVMTPSGDIQNIPIQLTPAQIQAITLQMQGKQPGQPILVQTQPSQGGDDQSETQVQGEQTTEMTQPLFQVPLNIGGQQVFIQQSADSLQEQGVEVHEG
ncbi:hypothetical protein LSH36_123g02049 [Paralvinella palmiformis]|uniref:Nuclear transcription factor Y subunit gamma n=1 Tax=Paralvinella palmiformis TaxID=53620 RepID=A0AAD9JYU2_9ANNE|nr:hypothetical protein LSH36_123g02049 [Paralvinella palmiformis]